MSNPPPATKPGWAADGREYRIAMSALLVACALIPIGFAVEAIASHKTLYPDFFGFWTFGRFVLSHPPATIYDTNALYAFQATFGMANDFYPFPYPAWILLVLAPLAMLPFAAAMSVWVAATFAAMVIAIDALAWPRLIAAFLLVVPTSAIGFLTGQNGFLSAALLLGGLRLLPTQPLVAGALLASVAYKPQLAIMVPFVLLFGGHWRAMLGAVLASIALSLTATLAFGAAIWSAWLAVIVSQASSLAMGRETLLDMMPTVTAAVLLLHGAPWLARAAQLAVAAAALLAVWRVRHRQDPSSRAVVPLATLLATPYAFDYDLPMVTTAVLAVLAATPRITTVRLIAMLGCLISPALLLARAGPAAAIVPLVAVITLCMLVSDGAAENGSCLQKRTRNFSL